MKRLLWGGIIGAVAAVGLSFIMSLIAMEILNPPASRERGIFTWMAIEPWKLRPLRDGWGLWETFYGLVSVIGIMIGILWAKLAMRGQTPGTPTARIYVRPALTTISLGIALILAIAGTSLVLPPVRFAVVGWYRGENFYHGMPVSYWLDALKSACEPVKVPPDQEGLVAIFGGMAVEGLIKIVAEDIKKDAVPGLVEMLHDPNPTVRMVAARTLHRIGPEAAEATPALIDVVKHDKEPRVRLNAALALVKMGPAAKDAIPALIELIKKKDNWRGPWSALNALAKMGPAAKDAVPTLIELIKTDTTDNGVVRSSAYEALKKIDPEAAEKHAMK